MSEIEITTNQRNFENGKFTDRNGYECSIQKSSSAEEDCIWLGIDNPKPQIMVKDAHRLGIATPKNNGWVDFEIPKEVLLSTRMHLTRKQVKELLPILRQFVKNGELS
jgi:hypothetical protein